MKKILNKIGFTLFLLTISTFGYHINELNINQNNSNIINASSKSIINTYQEKKDNSSFINNNITNFTKSKKILESKIYNNDSLRIDNYCGCNYDKKKNIDINSCGFKSYNGGDRYKKIEWEHIVPAENFGRSFKERKYGTSNCIKNGKFYKGRECAQTNKIFSKIEGDLYNLIPVNGEVNGLRSNYNYNMVSTGSNTISNFGKCDFKIDLKYKIAEPNNNIKGFVARISFYMEETYPNYYSISDKQRKIFDIWDKNFPVTKDECDITKDKNINEILIIL